mgnify:CR=1 FL=1
MFDADLISTWTENYVNEPESIRAARHASPCWAHPVCARCPGVARGA